ncbi:MAG TPA: carbon storage regulator [Gemmataceae bacterium]|jgi:carbon storage regulator CsrA|nr:carbon storage regulator [Gemmataceae bacterium]
MLVLSRKSNESVVIGGTEGLRSQLTVTVLEIRAGKVKLGFNADPSITVRRSELMDQVRTGEMPVGTTEVQDASSIR